MEINVVDMIMGGGKTSAAKNYINSSKEEQKFMYVTPYLDGAQYRALIVPQTTADGPLVVVTVDGVDYTLSRAMTFKANKQHKFTITLNKTSNGVNIGIGGWTEDEEDYGGSAE